MVMLAEYLLKWHGNDKKCCAEAKQWLEKAAALGDIKARKKLMARWNREVNSRYQRVIQTQSAEEKYKFAKLLFNKGCAREDYQKALFLLQDA